MSDKLKEACGVFGVYNSEEDSSIGRTIFYGLYALQHRGQESAGIAVTSGEGINYHKEMGLVSEVFNDEILDRLTGRIGIGHVRYSTTEANTLINAQPLVVRYKQGFLAVAHNGNLVNASEIRSELEESGAVFQTEIDSEVMAFLIAKEHSGDIEKAVEICMEKIKGSYALVMMTEDALIGMRDPQGIRPLCLGKQNGSYILASESCALDTIDAEFIRDIEPGEIVIINKDGLKSIKKTETIAVHLCASLNLSILPGLTVPLTEAMFTWPVGKQGDYWRRSIRWKQIWLSVCLIRERCLLWAMLKLLEFHSA